MRFLGSAVVFSLVLQTVVRMILKCMNANTGLTGFQLQLELKYFYLYVHCFFKCIQIFPTVYASLFFPSVWTARGLADGQIHL